MENNITKIILLLVSYLIGSISPSFLIAKYIYGFDIRTKGSKNPGSTNTLRTMGKGPALITFVIDVLKGTLAAYLGYKFVGMDFAPLTGLMSILGHSYPFYLNFKGGKGVATSMGMAIIVAPELLLVCGITGILVIIFTKMVSLGSISGFVLLLIICIYKLITYGSSIKYIVFSIMAVVGIYRHRTNISRILKGNENKIGVKND